MVEPCGVCVALLVIVLCLLLLLLLVVLFGACPCLLSAHLKAQKLAIAQNPKSPCTQAFDYWSSRRRAALADHSPHLGELSHGRQLFNWLVFVSGE